MSEPSISLNFHQHPQPQHHQTTPRTPNNHHGHTPPPPPVKTNLLIFTLRVGSQIFGHRRQTRGSFGGGRVLLLCCHEGGRTFGLIHGVQPWSGSYAVDAQILTEFRKSLVWWRGFRTFICRYSSWVRDLLFNSWGGISISIFELKLYVMEMVFLFAK